jgi:hypothetical protein
MSVNLIRWLEDWLQDQRDGELEDERGFILRTLDNPGWLLTVSLGEVAGSSDRLLLLDGDPPCAENGNVGGETWLICEVKSGKFVGAGDPSQLARIIETFRTLVSESR